MSECYACHKPLEAKGQTSRRSECSSCGKDLRCCRNCKFYDETAHNQCSEPQSDRIVDKERANFCDYFRLKGDQTAAPEEKSLDDLFKDWH